MRMVFVPTRSRNSVASTPLRVTMTMIWRFALNSLTFVVNCPPEGRTPIVLPPPSALLGGHAEAPSDLIALSEAEHLASAEVSSLVPTGNRSWISLITLGTPFVAPGSLHAMRVLSPVDAPWWRERKVVLKVALNRELAPASPGTPSAAPAARSTTADFGKVFGRERMGLRRLRVRLNQRSLAGTNVFLRHPSPTSLSRLADPV